MNFHFGKKKIPIFCSEKEHHLFMANAFDLVLRLIDYFWTQNFFFFFLSFVYDFKFQTLFEGNECFSHLMLRLIFLSIPNV